MSMIAHPAFLRRVLLLDAATCAVMGLALALGAGPVAEITALPRPLLLYAGLALLPIAAFMASVATRRPIPTLGVMVVVLGNLGWAAASAAVLAVVTPNALGTALVIVQAVAVLALAELEFAGARRARSPNVQTA